MEEGGSSDESEVESNHGTKAAKGFSGAALAKVVGPKRASHEAEDPVYQRIREQVPAWPKVVSKNMKLRDIPYSGGGWLVHF